MNPNTKKLLKFIAAPILTLAALVGIANAITTFQLSTEFGRGSALVATFQAIVVGAWSFITTTFVGAVGAVVVFGGLLVLAIASSALFGQKKDDGESPAGADAGKKSMSPRAAKVFKLVAGGILGIATLIALFNAVTVFQISVGVVNGSAIAALVQAISAGIVSFIVWCFIGFVGVIVAGAGIFVVLLFLATVLGIKDAEKRNSTDAPASPNDKGPAPAAPTAPAAPNDSTGAPNATSDGSDPSKQA